MESMECNAVEWNGMESMECNAVEWNGMESMECIAVEWNGMDAFWVILGPLAHLWSFSDPKNAKSKSLGPFSAAYQTSFIILFYFVCAPNMLLILTRDNF